MSTWIVILGAGLVSFAFRFALVAGADRISLPPAVEHASRYVAPAAFAALAGGALLAPLDDGGAGIAIPVWLAAAVTVVVARRKSGPVAMGAGLGMFWITQVVAVLGAGL